MKERKNKVQKVILLTLIVGLSFGLVACKKERPRPKEELILEDNIEQEVEYDEEGNIIEGEVEKQKPVMVEVNKADLDKLKQELNHAKKDKEELDFFKNYTKDMLTTLTPEQYQKIVDMEWTYSLLINNVNFPTTGKIELSDDSFTVKIVEKRVDVSVLPEKDSLSDRVVSDVRSVLSIPSDLEFEQKHNVVSDTEQSVAYEFKNVGKGQDIELSLSSNFTKDLGFDNNKITISIK